MRVHGSQNPLANCETLHLKSVRIEPDAHELLHCPALHSILVRRYGKRESLVEDGAAMPLLHGDPEVVEATLQIAAVLAVRKRRSEQLQRVDFGLSAGRQMRQQKFDGLQCTQRLSHVKWPRQPKGVN